MDRIWQNNACGIVVPVRALTLGHFRYVMANKIIASSDHAPAAYNCVSLANNRAPLQITKLFRHITMLLWHIIALLHNIPTLLWDITAFLQRPAYNSAPLAYNHAPLANSIVPEAFNHAPLAILVRGRVISEVPHDLTMKQDYKRCV